VEPEGLACDLKAAIFLVQPPGSCSGSRNGIVAGSGIYSWLTLRSFGRLRQSTVSDGWFLYWADICSYWTGRAGLILKNRSRDFRDGSSASQRLRFYQLG
jgi:hypothetical protein